jgi:hypothetical protein
LVAVALEICHSAISVGFSKLHEYGIVAGAVLKKFKAPAGAV